jgi:hypothetical protein
MVHQATRHEDVLGGGVEEQLHILLTSALDAAQLHSQTTLPPGVRGRGTYWRGGWVDPRSGLDAEAKRKKNPITALAGNWTQVVQLVA